MAAAIDGDGSLEALLLGAGAACPTGLRDTTAMAIGGASGWVLVDCPGGVVHKLARHGIRAAEVRRLLLTHDHVDHVYGLPHLLHALKLVGFEGPLAVHGPEATLATAAAVVEAHGLDRPDDPELEPRPIPRQTGFEVSTTPDMRIISSPANHGRDAVSYRFDGARGSICHSGDTGPSEELEELARDAHLLFHDCAGLHRHRDGFPPTHSSALEAGRSASAAGVEELVLVHLTEAAERRQDELVREAAGVFAGGVAVGIDGRRYRAPRSGDRGREP